MAQFKCKLSSNIWQDFPNHFMSICSETWKRHQSNFSASTSLTETIPKPVFFDVRDPKNHAIQIEKHCINKMRHN